MVREIAYLPVVTEDGRGRPFGPPLVVDRRGRVRTFRPGLRRHRVALTAKYPEDESNNIFPREHYELFYLDGRWKSLGVQAAEDTVLVYDRVPRGALLWLRNLDKGVQERIFIYEKGRQVWY